MKKIIAVILAVSTLFITAIASEPTDISDHANRNAISLLCNLDIIKGYEDGSFRPDNQITRAEFVALILRTLNYVDISEGYKEKQHFSDVTADYWAAGLINLAYEIGYINGYSDGTFGGDRIISFSEGVTIMVSALGYDIVAEQSGGFPTGYLNQASQLRLLNNLSSSDNLFTRGMAAALIYNALDVNIMDSVVFTDGENEFVKTDATILSNLKISIKTGTVQAVYGAALLGSQTLRRDQIDIDGIVYETKLTGLEKYLGAEVRFYLKEIEDSDIRIVCHIVDRPESKLLTVSANDIEADTSLSTFVYMANLNRRSISLASDLTIVYNGKILSTAQLDAKYLRPAQGTVTLRSMNSGTVYDLVIVKEYENYVVSSVLDNKVYDVFGKILEIDFEYGTYSIIMTKDGQNVTVSDLRKNNILSVAKSADGNFLTISVSDNSVSGAISEQSTDNERITYLVDGAVYRLALSYAEARGNNNPRLSKLEVGDSGEFYLDVFGEIAYSVPVEMQDGLTYGYLVNAVMSRNLPEALNLQILTTNNAFEEFKIEKNIRFGQIKNGVYNVSACDPLTILDAVNKSGPSQIIQYKLNSENQISALYIADITANNSYLSEDVKQASFVYSNGLLDQTYIVDRDTVLFHIPNAAKFEGQFSANNALEYLKNGSRYPVVLYDIENSKVGAMLVVDIITNYVTVNDGHETVIDKVNSPVMLIEKARSIVNEDGVEYMALEGYSGKNEVSVLVSNTLSTAAKRDFRAGVVIQYETNKIDTGRAKTSDDDLVMVVYQVLIDCNDKSTEPFQLWNYYDVFANNAPICTSYGVVDSINIPNMLVSLTRLSQPDFKAPFVLGSGVTVLRYNCANNTVKQAVLEDIQVGQKVFVRQRFNNVRDVIIIEN